MGWLFGKTTGTRDTCGNCHGSGHVPRLGMAPGGRWVRVGTDPCPTCSGRGWV